MADDKELARLRKLRTPAPDPQAKIAALHAAMTAYDEADEKTSPAAQGSAGPERLTSRAARFWREIMHKKLIAAPAVAGLIVLPVAGLTALYLIDGPAFYFNGGPEKAVPNAANADRAQGKAVSKDAHDASHPAAPLPDAVFATPGAPLDTPTQRLAPGMPLAMEQAPAAATSDRHFGRSELYARPPVAVAPHPAELMPPPAESRDRVEGFRTNPVRAVSDDPVSTFSIDVDTASYSFVRRSLKQGILPAADTVRVEEMINYFPYDWEGPQSADTPFNSTVTVMPAPWNAQHKLMHVAIKGYELQMTAQPKANLVFLIDVSGSMNAPDKLPLLKSAFRLLVGRLKAGDTVSIVTYAGAAGTVLEPTRVAEKDRILEAIDSLQPGGSTAGEAGLREAYRLAEKSFVDGGVNRVMLATDGDFNVGQTGDEDLKRLIEQERKTGVYLSVFGFGRGNLNDRMMQTIAQNGNGTAAYIDTLQEAEKALVQEATSMLFPIARDVKIQVEFNPERVAEYRLIGYETRALNREDFNNDRVDAGDIGSGHSVTAIYEITPKGAPQQIDALRYGEAPSDNGGVANADEYAFVKVRYKLPDEETSRLIETPVTAANEVSSLDTVGTDQRFSVAVAAFGQKLRDEDAVADFGFDRIEAMASAARGADPFGYRAEFLALVRLAAALAP